MHDRAICETTMYGRYTVLYLCCRYFGCCAV